MPSLLLPHHAEVTPLSSPAITHCHLSAPAVICHCSSSPAPTHSLPAPSATSQLFPAPFPPLPIPAVLGTTLHDLMPCPYLSRSPCGWCGMMGYLPAPCPALSPCFPRRIRAAYNYPVLAAPGQLIRLPVLLLLLNIACRSPSR